MFEGVVGKLTIGGSGPTEAEHEVVDGGFFGQDKCSCSRWNAVVHKNIAYKSATKKLLSVPR